MAKKCPKCGGELVRIVYGLPTEEAFEASERGEIHLGGCCVFDDDPEYHCNKCGKDYYKDLSEYKG